MRIRTYSELRRLGTFEERYEYLAIGGGVGVSTFGYDRYLNQRFYTSREWKQVRDAVIARDEGRDLGVPGYEIHDRITIHHMNPVTPEQLKHGDDSVLDIRYLVTTTHQTHNAIHYGDSSLLPLPPIERSRGDTKLW